MEGRLRVALVGVGATGAAIARSLLEHADAELVAAVDADPAKARRDLGDVVGVGPLGLVVTDDLDALSEASADVAAVTTGSRLADVAPVLERLAALGVDAVSLCEELSYPWRSHPEPAGRLHRAAVEHGVSILSTGCNPGLVLDTLPIVLSAGLEHVDRIEIERTADLTPYGRPNAGKFGLGLPPDAFRPPLASGEITGHIGFEQSLAHVAAALGWALDGIEVDPPEPAVIAGTRRVGAHLTIEPGTVAAVRQEARAIVRGRPAITCRQHFGFLAEGDGVPEGDRWTLTGGGRRVTVTAPDGLESWATTIAVLVNLLGAAAGGPPGLLTMSDVPVGRLACKGSRPLRISSDSSPSDRWTLPVPT